MRRAKYILPGMGFVVVLVLAAVRAPVEMLIYSVLIEICIFVITDPYKIIHYWLSAPARWIMVSIITVNTLVIRMHLTAEFVIIPMLLSLAALIAISRFNIDWRAQRAYKESPTVAKAMSVNEESSAWKSWIYHGKEEVLEMAYRVGRYTGQKPFNPVDAYIWQAEQKRIGNHEPVANSKQCITTDRMLDFLGMCYRLGYLRSVSYKAELLKERKRSEWLNTELKTEKEHVKQIKLDKKELQVIIEGLEKELMQSQADVDSIRECWSQDIHSKSEWKKERDVALADCKRVSRYAEQFEQQVEELQEENRKLKKRIEELENSAESPPTNIQVVRESVVSRTAKKNNAHTTKADKRKIVELRNAGHTVEQVAQITGWSERTVKRATAEAKKTS